MGKRRANGEGSLRQRKDGRWECTFMVGWKDNGRPKTKSFYGPTQEAVLRKAREWKVRCSPTMLATKDYLFSEWADMWFALHKETITPTTQEHYKYTLRELKAYFGRKKIKDIRAYDIEVFLQSKRNLGRARSTLAQYKGMLYQIMHKAEANDLIPKNPVRFVEKIRNTGCEKNREAFSAEEIRTLFRELPHNRIGLSIRLLIGTGMRPQELLALEPKHISENGSEIRIEQAVQQVKGTVSVGPPKTWRSRRVIPVPATLQSCARELRQTNRTFIWEEKNPGTPCNPSFFRKEFREALEAVNSVRVLTPHCCRHTYVSQMQALGVDPYTIQSIVGHADFRMTEHYLHIQEPIRREAAEKFSTAFSV